MSSESPHTESIPECDLAILTVIQIEHQQVLRAFGVSHVKSKSVRGRLYWETRLFSNNTQRELEIVIGNIAQAGPVQAALRTSRLLRDYNPKMVILVGIAAGWREKHQIGKVIWPRNILNASQMEHLPKGKDAYRPTHAGPSPSRSRPSQPRGVNSSPLSKWIVRFAPTNVYEAVLMTVFLTP